MLHLFSKNSNMKNYGRAVNDGIRSMFPDKDKKTPFDYSHEINDYQLSELILEQSANHQVKIVYNFTHVLNLINSDFSLAKDTLEGIFSSSDICIEDFKS